MIFLTKKPTRYAAKKNNCRFTDHAILSFPRVSNPDRGQAGGACHLPNVPDPKKKKKLSSVKRDLTSN